MTSPQEDYREIALSQNKVALVDTSDYEMLMQYNWYAIRHAKSWYALRSLVNADGVRTSMSMHRTILPLSETPGFPQLDHWDLNGLNNRRYNLRPTIQSGNMWNRGVQANSKSRVKGAYWVPRLQRYRVKITVFNQQIHLGYVHDLRDAAKLYNQAAIEYHGEFACLNEID